ncbi:ABC-2 transporter permease [Alkaliphilus oremlandii]|nr:ABC-2 transporter permease [Alkaliphilus oremlandii]
MFNLIRKEFMIQKKYLWYYVFYGIFMLLVFSVSSNESSKSAYILAGVSVVYMFIQYSCAIEDKNNSEKVFNSLPISREAIVLSKYAAVMVFAILDIVLLSAISYIVARTGFMGIQAIGIIDVITILFTISILTGAYLPIYFKFGYIKAKILNIVLFLGFFSASMLVGQLLKHFKGSKILYSTSEGALGHWLTILGDQGVLMALLCIGLLVMAISSFISVAFYRNREFS